MTRRDPLAVDLAQDVWVITEIPQDNHPALRSGFAGYPANPRWSTAKFRAWKAGRELRNGLKLGTLTIRTRDSLLVPTTSVEPELPPPEPRSYRFLAPKQILVTEPAL
ncbi:MAG: hypothetical protein HC890_10510 [Chloroflexaceae bacterium]|nr:hypothetical protein [Chloroflexaceae bacterium]